MLDDIKYSDYEKLIYDNTNVSSNNVLKDFFRLFFKLVVVLVLIYFAVFMASGITIKFLPIEKQIALENFLTSEITIKSEDFSKDELKRVNSVKNLILSHDKTFPKTSNLNVKLIKSKELNALCAPNGNIYFTSALYEKLKTDDKLLFVMAHEMAHYKNKDHLMNLRQDIASSIVLISLYAAGTSAKDYANIASATMDLSELNYSRRIEARADRYAGKLLLEIYGTNQAGIDVLKILKNKKYPKELTLFLTHPSIEQRVENMQKMKLDKSN